MAIKLVKPEDRAANPIAQLAAQADQADQEQAVQTASQNRLAALLPPARFRLNSKLIFAGTFLGFNDRTKANASPASFRRASSSVRKMRVSSPTRVAWRKS